MLQELEGGGSRMVNPVYDRFSLSRSSIRGTCSAHRSTNINARELQLHRIDDATTEDYNEKSTRGSPRERTLVKNRSRVHIRHRGAVHNSFCRTARRTRETRLFRFIRASGKNRGKCRM
uniref:Uncharacterized protein n=1 Tax=Trichogramma kaykai TaxID=54128 RepID=A0ABD2XR18_9HYME